MESVFAILQTMDFRYIIVIVIDVLIIVVIVIISRSWTEFEKALATYVTPEILRREIPDPAPS